MPEAAAGGGGGGANAQEGGGWFNTLFKTIARYAFIWAVMAYMKGWTGGDKAAPPPTNTGARLHSDAPPGSSAAAAERLNQISRSIYRKGYPIDMYAFVTEQEHVRYYDQIMDSLVWTEKAWPLAEGEDRKFTYNYVPSPAVQNNASVYLHVLFMGPDATLDHTDPNYRESKLFGSVINLIKYHPEPKNTTGVNLLSNDVMPEVKPEDTGPRPIVSFITPNMTVNVVDHFQHYPKAKGIPPQISPHMVFDNSGNYYPIIHFNEFWMLRDKLVRMNDTVTNVTLHMDLGMVSLWWWQLMMQMDQSFNMQKEMGMQQDGESDEVKRILLEGNPVLLAITSVVSLLHTVFDMLAFKNDIGFWKDNKSMEGLSARSVIINAFCQLVILLYLVDNDTSMVVLFSSFVGTCIEFWKVTKAMKVSTQPSFPFLKLEDRASYTQSKTKQYDQEASKYLSWALYPLVGGYAVYSLLYKTHKSWYSWILNSLVGAVYMFGFILMCPQLYLNYKLKSVAHLPWRQMTYKFLNTIIDDLFAFVIKMPLLHRLSVFRDDLIFVIFLYQRWIYRVDKTRVNEFGWAPEEEKDADAIEGEDAKEGTLLEDKAEGEGPVRKRKGDKKQEEESATDTAAGSEEPAAAGKKKDK